MIRECGTRRSAGDRGFVRDRRLHGRVVAQHTDGGHRSTTETLRERSIDESDTSQVFIPVDQVQVALGNIELAAPPPRMPSQRSS